jgi:phosphatidylglycerophosphate synthase
VGRGTSRGARYRPGRPGDKGVASHRSALGAVPRRLVRIPRAPEGGYLARMPHAPGVPRSTFWTLPNAVSLSRVVLAAGFVASSGAGERLALVGVASFTDMLDGWLARRLGATSRWGALIDPIADRIFVLAAVGTFVANGALSPLQAMALLLRDVMTVIGFFVAKSVSWLRVVTFRARPLGKAVTGLQLATLLALLVVPRTVPALVLAVGATAVASTIDYTLLLWRERARDGRPDPADRPPGGAGAPPTP